LITIKNNINNQDRNDKEQNDVFVWFSVIRHPK